MALKAQDPILAADFVTLKARVKAEMQRRHGYGSLSTYAGSAYDYTNNPKSGVVVQPEHVNKIVEPINKIKNTGIPEASIGGIVKAIDSAEIALTTYEKISPNASQTGCASMCSGLCSSSCYNACASYSPCSCGSDACSGSCTATCANNCMTSCGNGGQCGMSCWNNCDPSWSGGCGTSCKASCSGGCSPTYDGPN